jgi:hypothetical protein
MKNLGASWNDPPTNTLRTATIEQTFNPKTVKTTICNTWGLSEKSYLILTKRRKVKV